MIGISACLGGLACRYDGQKKEVPELMELVETGEAVMVCPEVIGGLPIPRDPAEIIGGNGFDVWKDQAKVWTTSGEDVTEAYKNGAIKAYQKLQEKHIDLVIMKEKSPSCGTHSIYDGSFSGIKKNGAGVAPPQFSQGDRRSGTVDQFAAEYRFNLPQGAAQRRLANRQPTGGIGKMAQLGQGDEILKLFKRERGQPLPGFVHHRVRYGGPAQ